MQWLNECEDSILGAVVLYKIKRDNKCIKVIKRINEQKRLNFLGIRKIFN